MTEGVRFPIYSADDGDREIPYVGPRTVRGLPLVDPVLDVDCPLCQRPMSAHDADPIGAGLTQYTCPESGAT